MTEKERTTAGVAQTFANGIHVLIVDDHELLRDGLTELLSHKQGITVCGEAVGEDEAMDLVREQHPNLVIVDVSLQQGDGILLVKRIKQFDHAIQVVVCSMHDEKLYADRSLQAGASGYVPKQAPAREMLDAIAAAIDGRIYVSPTMAKQQTESDPRDVGTSVASLANREREVFTLIGQGFMNGEIADQLGVSPRTIDTYRERIKAKLDLRSASELNRRAVQWVLLAE